MDRPVKPGERWSTFIFDGIDCAELGVYAITNSGTYTTNLAPTFSDKKTTVTAYDGSYYYGTQITGQKFSVNMFADNLTFPELCHLKAWLNPRHIGKLIFSDQPYKYYYVKPTSIGTLANIPLSTVQTPAHSILGDFLEGDPVYTGKFTVTFETVGSAYGYGLSYYRDNLVYDALNKYGIGVYPENYYYDSGLLYKDMSPLTSYGFTPEFTGEAQILVYNPGDARSYPRFIFYLEEGTTDDSKLYFVNNTTNEACTVDMHGLPAGKTILDFSTQTISYFVYNEKTQKEEEIKCYGRIQGNAISISEREPVITIPDTVTTDVEDYYKTEYDTIYIENYRDEEAKEEQDKDVCAVTINPMAIRVSEAWVGRFFCINDNGGKPIKSVNTKTNQLFLDTSWGLTYDILPADIDQDGNVLRHAGFPCNYIQINENLENLPEQPQVGDVYQYEGKWYMYKYGGWMETAHFNNESQFKDINGDFATQYLLLGANIITLNDLTLRLESMPACSMMTEVLPRYL